MDSRKARDGPESYWLMGERESAALPADLFRALDWLRGHLAEPVELEELASLAGVRPRTLETHFKIFLKTTPLGWIRRMRLARAHRELQRGHSQATVTEVALGSGFTELGRFAAHYRAAFGEVPSTTLRRGRSWVGSSHDPKQDESIRLTWKALPYAFAIAPRECGAALDLLENARDLAPNYGLPVALSAWCRAQRAAHGFGANALQDRAQGCQLAANARTLAPNDALVLTLASGALTLARHLGEADRLLERALALDPWSPYAWVRRGWASVYVGDPQSAFRELEIALRIAPFGPLGHIGFIGMGCAHFALERYEQAARWVQTGTEAYPGAIWADRIAVAAAVHAGATGEARRMTRRLMRKDPDLTISNVKQMWPFPPPFMARLSEGLEIGGVPRS